MGPRAILTCLTFVLGAHTPALAPAQQPATPDSRKSVVQVELQQLVQRVQEGRDARGVAFARLVKKGPEAAVAVAEALDSAKPKATARLLQLLEEMGPAATESVDVLQEKAETAEGEERRLLYHTLVSIAPHMDAGAWTAQITAAQQALYRMMVAEEDEKLRKVIAESWFRSVQYSVRLNAGAVLTASTSVDELSIALHKIKSYSFRHELAAVLLGYKSKEANTAIHAMLAKIRKQPYRPITTTGAGRIQVKYPCGPRNNRRIAAALLRLRPAPEVALEAHAYLLKEGLVHERWQAIHTIRRHQARSIPAVEKALVDLSRDTTADRELRQEAITTIGMLSKVEEPTLELLRKLASDTSKGLAVRAKAALRQLERRK